MAVELENPCGHRCCAKCRAIYYTDYVRCPLDGEELVETDADPLIGATVAEHYVVEELIGEGAMGRVYRVHHSRLVHKQYALKVLLGDFAASASMRLRFASEAENASRLDHPNIARVVDFGRTETGLLYLVMELVEGTSLSAIVRQGPMRPRWIAELARRLCHGLAHAHERGIVHRDFKPDNIIVVDDGTPRIVDFGIAISVRDDDMRLTTSGVMCTPAYAAPEQLVRGQIDHRADLYGLGVTMYEMVTGGVMPFRGDPRKVMALKMTARPPRVDRVQPVPARLADVIERLLERDPDARFASAMEVARAIEVAMVPPPRRSRRRVMLGAAAVVACCLAVGETRVSESRIASVEPATGGTARESTAVPARLSATTVPSIEGLELALGLPAIEPTRPSVIATTIASLLEATISIDGARSPPRAATGSPPSVRVAQPAPRTSSPLPPPRVASAASPPPPPDPEPPAESPPATLLAAVDAPRDAIAPWPEPIAPSPPPAESAPHPRAQPARVAALRARMPRIVKLDVEGGLPPSVVRRAVERVLPRLSACSPISAGQPVAATFSVEQSRRAGEIRVTGAAGRCVAAALGALRTETEPDVGEARVQLSIGFP